MSSHGCPWPPAPADWTLSPGDVHVWSAPLDQPALAQQLLPLLSPPERERADRYHFERHRQQSIIARGVLRLLLGRYTSIPPTAVQFSHGPQGKPALAQPGPLRFNLAHSHGLAVYAMTLSREVGIDVEQLRPFAEAGNLAARFFAPGEIAVLRNVPSDQKMEMFFHCWTRKEAYIKAIGKGLSCPLDEFEVALAPGEPLRLLHVAGNPEEPARWSLHSLTPAPNYVATLAVEGHDCRLSCWQWPADAFLASVEKG